ADIARELAKAGLNVMLFNQRSVEEILNMIQVLSSVVGVGDKGVQLVKRFEAGLAEIRESAKQFVKKPKVYFEEWDEPMISGIRWVSELGGATRMRPRRITAESARRSTPSTSISAASFAAHAGSLRSAWPTSRMTASALSMSASYAMPTSITAWA